MAKKKTAPVDTNPQAQESTLKKGPIPARKKSDLNPAHELYMAALNSESFPPKPTVNFDAILQEYRVRAGISRPELGKALGVNKDTITNWETNRSKPTIDFVPALCALFGLEPHQLLGMQQPNNLTPAEDKIICNLRLLSKPARNAIEKTINQLAQEEAKAAADEMKASHKLFIIRPGEMAAGTGDYVPEEPPTYVILKRTRINEYADGIAIVDGRSMEPAYHDGDRVYYEETSAANPGDDVIVDTDDGAVIKRLAADNTLYSVNPDLPFPAKNEDNTLVIRGRVLGIVQPEDKPKPGEQSALEELFSDEIDEFDKQYGTGY